MLRVQEKKRRPFLILFPCGNGRLLYPLSSSFLLLVSKLLGNKRARRHSSCRRTWWRAARRSRRTCGNKLRALREAPQSLHRRRAGAARAAPVALRDSDFAQRMVELAELGLRWPEGASGGDSNPVDCEGPGQNVPKVRALCWAGERERGRTAVPVHTGWELLFRPRSSPPSPTSGSHPAPP